MQLVEVDDRDGGGHRLPGHSDIDLERLPVVDRQEQCPSVEVLP